MAQRELLESKLTGSVISAFYEVYNTLGFGFLEHVYKAALERELLARGHRVAREMGVVVFYKGDPLVAQRLDMIVDDKLVVETKSTAELATGAQRQLHNYLRATNLEVGLLLHFGLQPKFHRVVELRARKATMKKGDTDSTDATDSTDRSSPEPELRSQRAGVNFVNGPLRPGATNLTGVPFTISSGPVA